MAVPATYIIVHQRILQSYWQSHTTNEDAFRPLVELLGKRECYGQAEEYYAHLCLALEQEGRQPDHRTQEVMTLVRALRIQRKPHQYQAVSSVVETEQASSVQSLSLDGRQQAVSLPTGQSESLSDIPGSFQESIESELTPSGQATLLPDNEANTSSLVSTTHQIPVFNDQRTLLLPSSSPHVKSGLFLPGSLPVDLVPTANSLKDCAVWFGMRQAHIFTYIVQWRRHALFCGELQEQLDQEIKMFDQVRYLFDDSEKYSISRRQVLISIAMLPVALLKVQQGYSSGIDIEEFLPRCTASITAVWHLLKGREFITAEEVLLECLPTLLAFARKASPYKEMAAQLASQNCLLMSLMARHRGNNLALDEWYSRKAVFYSESTENLLLKIGTLKQLADTCYYRGYYDHMLTAYEKAWQYISMATTMDEIPVLIRARIYTGLAYACAKNNDAERAKNLLSEAYEFFPHVGPEADDHIPLYADCGIHSLYLWEGLTRHLLNQTEDAAKTYAQVEHLPSLNILVPERTRVEIITHQAANALVQGKMEAFCSYLTTTMNGIKSIQSEQRRQEAVTVYQQARQKWPNESHILELADLFVPLR